MRRLENSQRLRHHAFVIEAEAEQGIGIALEWAERELGMQAKGLSTGLGAGNPDIVVLRYGLLSVEDARQIAAVAASAPLAGEHKAIIIAASRAYHEAQNALLKIFEEPPQGAYLFLALPSAAQLLPTLRSRVQVLRGGHRKSIISESAKAFLKANKEKRSVVIKKLVSGKDEEERRELRDEAIALVNGVEAIAYQRWKEKEHPALGALLGDLGVLRSYLHDRSAPTRMILEHLSLVIPDDLV